MKNLFQKTNVRRVSNNDQLTRAEKALRMSFPPSYKEFCLKYGSGMIGKLYMIYIPFDDIEDEKSMTYRARILRERLENSRALWRDDDMKIGVDVWEGVEDPRIVERAVFFGQSENGHEIFWDVKGEGEYGIYVEGGSTVRFGGKTLDEFILRCQSKEIKSIFGPGYEPLPSLFEGRD